MMTLTNAAQNAGILEVDNKGRDIHDVADEWLANNEATWKPWVAAAMK